MAWSRPTSAASSPSCRASCTGAPSGPSSRTWRKLTFLRVFRALPGFASEGPARLSTWILTIATRLALDELRRPRPELLPVEAAARLPAPTGPDRVEEARLRAAIDRALGDLSPEQRAVFVLREHHDLAYDEIARSLELDLNTVKTRLFRARTALRAALSEVHRAD